LLRNFAKLFFGRVICATRKSYPDITAADMKCKRRNLALGSAKLRPVCWKGSKTNATATGQALSAASISRICRIPHPFQHCPADLFSLHVKFYKVLCSKEPRQRPSEFEVQAGRLSLLLAGGERHQRHPIPIRNIVLATAKRIPVRRGLAQSFNRLAISALLTGDFPNALTGNESLSYPCRLRRWNTCSGFFGGFWLVLAGFCL
jgi:hypothetical protein